MRKIQLIFLLALASLVPLVLLITLPPTWNYYDSMIQLLYPPNHSVLLHYPPLYWFFLKVCNLLILKISDPFNPDLFNAVFFHETGSEHGLYLVIIVQHLLLVLSLLYFALGVGDTFKKRFAVILVFMANPALFLFTHGVYSEALWVSLILINLGATFRMAVRNQTNMAHSLVYVLSLWGVIMTRHAGALLVVFLPALMLVRLVQNRDDSLGSRSKNLFLSLCLAGSAFVFSVTVQKMILKNFDIVDRPIWGRTGAYSITDIPWKEIGEEERNRVIEELQKKTGEEIIRDAIPLVFREAAGWLVPWQALKDLVYKRYSEKGPEFMRSRGIVDEESLRAETDRVLNQICWLFWKSGSPFLLRDTWKDLKHYLSLSGSDLGRDILLLSMKSVDLYNQDPSYAPLLPEITSLNPRHIPKYVALSKTAVLKILGVLKEGPLILMVALVSLWGCLTGRLKKDIALFIALSLFLALSYATLISWMTAFVSRYAIFNSLLVHVALALLVVNLRFPVFQRHKRH